MTAEERAKLVIEKMCSKSFGATLDVWERVLVRHFQEHADDAYKERDQVLSLAVHLAKRCGYWTWMGVHEGPDWDPKWTNIVFIQLPTGQVSWHIHDDELPLFPKTERRAGYKNLPSWDGHTTEEKYKRIKVLVTGKAE